MSNKIMNPKETFDFNELSDSICNFESCFNYKANNDDKYPMRCCGCGCLGTSETADNSSANVAEFRSTPGNWKGDVTNGNGICILMTYNESIGKYEETDHGSNCGPA